MTSATRLTVALGERSYPIIIGQGLLVEAATHLLAQVRPARVAVLTQPPIAVHHAERVVNSLRAADLPTALIEVPDGEQAKCFAVLERVIDEMLQSRLTRQACLVALGGGVVGDLGGFAAACYLRGIDFVQIPTTLLAMVDASVGGKTAINTARGKNLVGAFWQPRLVLADLDTLKTLPERHLRAGLAEVIKHGVIADGALFEALEAAAPLAPPSAALLERMVRRSCEIKAAVVAEDERETTGRRMILNLGHTVGHAVENVGGYHDLLHGECVAVGMVIAAEIAVALGQLSAADAARIERLCQAAGLPVRIPAMPWRRLAEAMQLDKKARGDRLRFVLPTRIGAVMIRDDVPLETVERVCRARGAID